MAPFLKLTFNFFSKMPNIKVSPPSAASRVSVSVAKDEAPPSKKDVNNEKLMVRFYDLLLDIRFQKVYYFNTHRCIHKRNNCKMDKKQEHTTNHR